MTSTSNLQQVLSAGHFAVTGELGPPTGADPQAVKAKADILRGSCDAYNLTDNQTAVVRMNAIPSSEQAEDLRKEQAMHAFSDMFDKTQTYTGQLELDLSSGKAQKYSEKLQSQWLVVDPPAEQKDSKEPDAVKMSVVRSYSLERID